MDLFIVKFGEKMSKILRLKQVQEFTGLSRSSIYALLKDGKFPHSIKLSERSVGWYEAEIQGWINSRKPTGGVQ